MTRLTRKLVSLLGIAAVLFAQLATTAHACPMQFMPDEAADLGAEFAANSAGHDAESPALCQKHCENGQQNVKDTPQLLASVSPAPTSIATLVIDPAAPLAETSLTPSLQRTTSPPLAIRHCCFRI